MTDPSPSAVVVLRATVTVNGVTVTAQNRIPLAQWNATPSEGQERARAWVRERLGAAIVQRLEPAVEVEYRDNAEDAVAAALRLDDPAAQ
jgi:hypothetical protein